MRVLRIFRGFFSIGILGLAFLCEPLSAKNLLEPQPFRRCREHFLPLIAPELSPSKALASTYPGQAPITERAEWLSKRYGWDPQKINWDSRYPLLLNGGDRQSVLPRIPLQGEVIDLRESYDVIIAGGGPSALIAAAYLTRAGKTVLILERDGNLGGLSSGAHRVGMNFSRGAAYMSGLDVPLFKQIYQDLGLENYRKLYPIKGIIDSYLWNGKIYKDIWNAGLAELPASFALFKKVMELKGTSELVELGRFQRSHPFVQELDKITMGEWVRTMPFLLEKFAQSDPAALEIYQRFQADPKVPKLDPMKDLLNFLDLYGRAALGGDTATVSALSFASFYSTEIATRYSSNVGAGVISVAAMDMISKYAQNAFVQYGASVVSVENVEGGTQVEFIHEAQRYRVRGKFTVMATPLNVSARAIKNFAQMAPRAHSFAAALEHRDHLVFSIHTAGHVKTGTYDLWMRDDADYSGNEAVDVVDGRWMDAHGLERDRGVDDRGLLTLYRPLSSASASHDLSDKWVISEVEKSVDFLRNRLAALNLDEIKIVGVEVNRWPSSLHVVKPGHFAVAHEIEKGFKRIFVANGNAGLPCVEEAIFQGHHAAQQILNFKDEN